jgi:hypothetical protein
MNTDVSTTGTLIHVTEELTPLSRPGLARLIGRAERTTQAPIVVSLATCRRVDPPSMTLLITSAKRIGPRFSVVVPLDAPCRRVFEVTGFSRLTFVRATLGAWESQG